MISIWNRRELLTTYNMEDQSRIRDILSSNHIDYRIKTRNRNNPSFLNSRPRSGTLNINMDYYYEYIIYVNKDKLEEATAIMNGSKI